MVISSFTERYLVWFYLIIVKNYESIQCFYLCKMDLLIWFLMVIPFGYREFSAVTWAEFCYGK
jgi:hypothetical protein